MIFRDRADAGRKLGRALSAYRGKDAIVYALPRGGVVPAVEVAMSLGASLDLIVVRKVGHPDNPEYAMAAVADDGHTVRNFAESESIDRLWFERALRTQQAEACRRRDLYLAGSKPAEAEGKIAIIVDDGLATGLTMSLAIAEVRHRKPSKIVVAVPVAPSETIAGLRDDADEIIVLHIVEEGFYAVGAFYEDFPQLTDNEVVGLLRTFAATKERPHV